MLTPRWAKPPGPNLSSLWSRKIGVLSEASGALYDRQRAVYYADHDLKPAQAVQLARAELGVRHDIYAYDTLAWTLFKAGQLDEAALNSRRALKWGTRDAQLWFHAVDDRRRARPKSRGETRFGKGAEHQPAVRAVAAATGARDVGAPGRELGAGANRTRAKAVRLRIGIFTSMTLLRWCVFCLALSWVWMRPASAHPMGNFSINHYARFEAQSGALKLRYILDFAEIPTSDQMARLDANGNSQISATEKAAYLQSAAPQFLSGLNLQINGRKVVLVPQSSNLESRPGAGGLPTLRVWVDTAAPLPGGAPARVSYEDSNFAGRTGWMEIIATAGSGTALTGSDAATTDISHQLTVFPLDAGIVPPRQNSARFSVARAGTATENPQWRCVRAKRERLAKRSRAHDQRQYAAKSFHAGHR